MLQDPANDRQVFDVITPPLKPLDPALIFSAINEYRPDWKLISDHLEKGGRIDKEQTIKIIRLASKIFKNESNLIQLQDPLTIVGDIHGQFYDLLKILQIGGSPAQNQYVFLGDYVDRGSFSIEVLILLYSLKINYPNSIYLLRGNHECKQMTTYFNFYDECRYKYDQEVYEIILDSFNFLPLACLINGQFIALHGGISPQIQILEDINCIDRNTEPPRYGMFCDILWADPVDNEEGICEGEYRVNDNRGCSFYFGAEAAYTFLEQLMRLRQMGYYQILIQQDSKCIDGVDRMIFLWLQLYSVLPTIVISITIRVPQQSLRYQNNNQINIIQFLHSAHPYLLPNFMDIFSWSIPFVAEKVTQLLYHLLRPSDDEIDSDEEVQEKDVQKFQQMTINNKVVADTLQNKVKFIAKMMKVQGNLRKANEIIVQLGAVCPDNRISKALLVKNDNNPVGQFSNAKKVDCINEKRPNQYIDKNIK